MGRITKFLATLAVGIGVSFGAQAGTITQYLDIYTLGGSPGFQVGTVTVTDVAGGVSVNVSLVNGYKFVNTGGPHDPFAFNVSPQITTTATYTSISPVIATALVGANNQPFGAFSNGIQCTSCQNGAPGAFNGPLTFNLIGTGISTAIFGNNSLGYMFAADVLNVATGATGAVAGSPTSSGCIPGTPGCTVVPEPASMAILGTGLLALGAVVRRRRRRTA